MIFLDTESVGSTGPLVTIQFMYRYHEKIMIWRVWEEKIKNTLYLIRTICEHQEGVCGFNLVHDWFMLTKWYNIFRRGDVNGRPDPETIKRLEHEGPRFDDKCIKPVKSLDLMLVARAGQYQYLAKHKPIIIRKAPIQAIESIIRSLDQDITLPKGVYIRWRISEKRKYQRSDVKDIIGEFKGLSTSLKSLASIILKDPSIASKTFDKEVGNLDYKDEPDWKPWGGEWLVDLQFLRNKFLNDKRAIEYAESDVEYTYLLWKDLGSPEGGDDDSELACLVGASHWYGFAVENEERLKEKIEEFMKDFLKAPTAPKEVEWYLGEHLDPTEQILLKIEGTGKKVLEELMNWKDHPVSHAAKAVQKARKAQNRIGLLEKLIKAKRFCFSMKIQGTLSSRMSGGSEQIIKGENKRLNAQGIPRECDFRSLFPIAFDDEWLQGGDFDAFEVSIAEAVYNDPQLTADLEYCQKNNTKFHYISGSEFYGCSQEEIAATKGSSDSKYNRSKNGFFAVLYGATVKRLAETLNIDQEQAEGGLNRIIKRYPKIKECRDKLQLQYQPIVQLGEVGSEIIWTEPKMEIESILGFKRFFTLEWAVIRGLYNLANSPPNDWKEIQGECRRTNRVQTISGAVQSAIYSAIFSLQAHVFRCAANHEIQSPGAQITKYIQRKIWDLQTPGILDWKVRPLNIHDEILCPTVLTKEVLKKVEEGIEKLKEKIPFLKMEWKAALLNWGEK